MDKYQIRVTQPKNARLAKDLAGLLYIDLHPTGPKGATDR